MSSLIETTGEARDPHPAVGSANTPSAVRGRWRGSVLALVVATQVVAGVAVGGATASAAVAARAGVGRPAGHETSTPRVPGYPVILASGGGGGIWYGGAIDDIGGLGSEPAEYVERIDYITPGGEFLDLGFPEGLASRFPRYFARGSGEEEWFLADRNEEPLPLLGEVSPLGSPRFKTLELNPKSNVRGLAMGPDGDLWATSTRRQGKKRVSAILRITPAGAVTSFSKGLRAGADPANITAGPGDAMWFTDTVGRIGRVDMDGMIREFPIGRPIVDGRPSFEPTRPILAGPDGALWFIAGPDSIGRMGPSGHVRFLTPRSSYRGAEASGDQGELVGLAKGPDGDMWFTRESGEVARIDSSGRVRTVTNRLAKAYGIAFGAGGVAWVGEGTRYILGLDYDEGELPARVATITASGVVKQYPPLPQCHVPRLLGLERVFAEIALEDRLAPECERLSIGHVTVRHLHRRGRMIVVSQTPRAGTPTVGYRSVQITLEPAPALPRACRAPAFYKLLVDTSQLIVWEVKKRSGPYPEEEFTDTDYACAPPDGHKRVVGVGFSGGTCGGTVLELVSAGSSVAVAESGGCQYGSSETLKAFDLRSGHELETTVDSEVGGVNEELPALAKLGTPVGYGAHAIAVDPGGDVAWVGETEAKAGQPAESVLYLHDLQGIRRVAAGTQITDVAFAGTTLSWKAGGVAASTEA
jgi:streptogramin lyase